MSVQIMHLGPHSTDWIEVFALLDLSLLDPEIDERGSGREVRRSAAGQPTPRRSPASLASCHPKTVDGVIFWRFSPVGPA
jgi:hypothetical protein